MSDNLKLWDAVRRPPEDALKGFKRGGGFVGTAIKPMWSIKAMTEQFGPCGEGWGMNEPQFNVQPANNEILVFCTLCVWFGNRSNFVFGVGGDKVLGINKYGPQVDDEAFKKAFTDALTNALKHLGVGADIHMGLWDGSKYAEDELAPTKTATRDDFKRLCTELAEIKTWDAYQLWSIKNADGFKALNPDLMGNLQHSMKAKEFCLDIAECRTADDLNIWNASNKADYGKLSQDAFDEVATAYKERKALLSKPTSNPEASSSGLAA